MHEVWWSNRTTLERKESLVFGLRGTKLIYENIPTLEVMAAEEPVRKVCMGLFHSGVHCSSDRNRFDHPLHPVNMLPVICTEPSSCWVEEICPYEETISDKIRREAIEAGIDPDIALAIAFCESHLDPLADNPTSSALGLFQILDMHGLSTECRLDAGCNIDWALNEMRSRGFGAWNASRSCWYS